MCSLYLVHFKHKISRTIGAGKHFQKHMQKGIHFGYMLIPCCNYICSWWSNKTGVSTGYSISIDPKYYAGYYNVCLSLLADC